MWTYPSYSGQHDMSKTLLLIGSKLPNSFKTPLSDIVFREGTAWSFDWFRDRDDTEPSITVAVIKPGITVAVILITARIIFAFSCHNNRKNLKLSKAD